MTKQPLGANLTCMCTIPTSNRVCHLPQRHISRVAAPTSFSHLRTSNTPKRKSRTFIPCARADLHPQWTKQLLHPLRGYQKLDPINAVTERSLHNVLLLHVWNPQCVEYFPPTSFTTHLCRNLEHQHADPSLAFTSRLSGAENLTFQCQNCGNFSARPSKRWEWFTFCFVPLIPFSLKPYHEVGCHICNFWQDVKYRPDVQQQMQGGGGQQPAVMMGGANGGHGAPPSGVPQYK